MKISDLIKFHDDFVERVNLLTVDQSTVESCKELDIILSSNDSLVEFSAHEKIQQAINQIGQLNVHYNEIKNQLLTVTDDIYKQIDALLPTVHRDANVPFKKQFKLADNEIYRNFIVSDDINRAIKSRVHQMSDWHFPGMQLGCRNAGHTAELVACDPLYLCDFDSKAIDQVSNQFNEIYNRRLRKYPLDSHQFGNLPLNQFGFIFSWMFFNFVELDDIKLYLSELLKILRPGGILMFSYNNGDMIESARLFESGMMSFVPKRKLLPICRDLGFEITNSFDFTNIDNEIKTISWLELRKPGELSTVKRAQAMGQVLRK